MKKEKKRKEEKSVDESPPLKFRAKLERSLEARKFPGVSGRGGGGRGEIDLYNGARRVFRGILKARERRNRSFSGHGETTLSHGVRSACTFSDALPL